MQRIKTDVRPGYVQKLQDMGFTWHTHTSGAPYWDESAYWSISGNEAEKLQTGAREGYQMILDTIEFVISSGQLALFGYSAEQCAVIEKSWEESDSEPTLYGRFDMAFDGTQPKILEFNGDNPGSLFETAMVQRAWAQELFPNKQQFNMLHERMLSIFKVLAQFNASRSVTSAWNPVLHITGLGGDPESEGTAAYLANCAEQAGISVNLLALNEIGLYDDRDGDPPFFVDVENQPIHTLLKLRPLDWMLSGGDLSDAMASSLTSGAMRIIEPAWKMLASNKRMMSFLWNRYAYHPLLLNTSMTPLIGMDQVRKPVTGYEGQNIVITTAAGVEVERTQGAFAETQSVYQERATLANADGNNAVFGVWLVDGDGVALSVRESDHLITDNNSRFVPHIIEG
jgi:glutathionylspermidine synthase